MDYPTAPLDTVQNATSSSRRTTRSATKAKLEAQPSPMTTESMNVNPDDAEHLYSSPLSSPPACLVTEPSAPSSGLLVKIKYSEKVKAAFVANKQLTSQSRPSTPVSGNIEISAPDRAASKPRHRKRRHNPKNVAHLVLDEDDCSSTGSELASKRQKLDDGDGEFVSSDNHAFPLLDIDNNVLSSAKPKKRSSRGKPKPKNEIYYVNVQDGRPEPHGRPLVWGDKRQPLCETLYYYKAYQGGAYKSDGVLHGFLVDKEVGSRDKFTDQILITSCGGGRTKDEKTGKMVQTADQSDATIAYVFLRALKEHLPVVVIAGQGNSISPSRLPHPYNVLSHFHITDVWFEKEGKAVTAMARFEKINLDEMSWWAPKDHVLSEPNFHSPKAEIQNCQICQQPSKVIYNQGFTCLQTQCTEFFKFQKPVAIGKLGYSEEFLAERTRYTGKPLGPISPPLLTEGDVKKLGIFGFEAKCKNGIVCPKCQCCSRRIEWRRWVCENPECDYVYEVNQHVISVAEAIEQSLDEESLRRRKSIPKEFVHDSIRVLHLVLGRYNVTQYTFPGEHGKPIGFLRHFIADEVINQQPDGPNDLFRQMQEDDFNLKRQPSMTAGSISEVLTDHWSHNWGAPYKYSVPQVSKGFNEARPVIIKAVMRLIWAGNQAVTDNLDPFVLFNEMLTVGYFENTHMGDHDDGETTLGPTVATLSLGAAATMTFRPKPKSAIGAFRGNKTNVTKNQKKPVVLSIKLNHGDIVIMHGCGIQQHYLHSVIPHGKLRFALTSRYVDPAKMKTDEEREYTLRAGVLPAGSEKYAYDGDKDSKPIVRTVDTMTRLQNHIDANIFTGDYSADEVKEALKKILDDLA